MSFIYNVKSTTVYKITGDFRSGTKLEEFKEFINGPRFGNITHILDLSCVIYMDSDSYKLVKDLRDQGFVVNFDLGSHVYKRFLNYLGDLDA